jgi:hypothetical protein
VTHPLLVPVVPSATLRAWPKHLVGGRARYIELGEALTRRYSSDAHFAAYSVPSVERRLCLDAAGKVAAGIPMGISLFDVDAAEAHKAQGGSDTVPASDAWWCAERAKIETLRFIHPDGFAYRTRGGYRLVYRLAEPFIITADLDAARWTARYLEWVAHLENRFDIVADPSCSEWVRLFRLPHATRDGSSSPEDLGTVGDPKTIGPWAPDIDDGDRTCALTLRRPKKPYAPSAPRARASAYSGDGVLFYAFRARGWMGTALEPGKWAVKCPNSASHSKGADFDTSTVLYAPDGTQALGFLHCSHAHCQHLTIREWLTFFSQGELEHARAAAGLPAKGAA